MHWMFRGAEGCSLQVALHLVERFRDLLCIACAASFQDAQKAAAVWWKELRRPRPPRLRASRARWAVASGKAGRCRSWARLCWMLWLWAAAGSRFETGRSPPKSCFNEGRSGCRQHNSQKKKPSTMRSLFSGGAGVSNSWMKVAVKILIWSLKLPCTQALLHLGDIIRSMRVIFQF